MPETPLYITFLGSGNAFAPGRYWSSFLVNDRYLFDPSPIVLPHMKMLGRDPNEIDLIFVTHFHADHWFGLPFLLLEYAELSGRQRPLTIVGPPGIEGRARAVTEAGYPNVFRKGGYELRWIEAGDGLEGEAAGVAFRAIEVKHAEGLACFGYRARLGDRTLSYSGDTVMCDALLPLAEGADVFVVECSCWDNGCGPHLSPADIVELRRRIAPSTRFVLTHLDAGNGRLGDGYTLAEDLATVTL